MRRLAAAFDVVLQVRFITFGEALADIEQFSTAALLKPPFQDDPVFHVVQQHLNFTSTTDAGASPPSSQALRQIDDIMAALKASLAGRVAGKQSLTEGKAASPDLQAVNDNLALAS